jgi:hypothetical protein
MCVQTLLPDLAEAMSMTHLTLATSSLGKLFKGKLFKVVSSMPLLLKNRLYRDWVGGMFGYSVTETIANKGHGAQGISLIPDKPRVIGCMFLKLEINRKAELPGRSECGR